MKSMHLQAVSAVALSSGAREALKWLALVLMTGDHVNKVMYAGSLPLLGELSRVVFPIFAVVFALNLRMDEGTCVAVRAVKRTLIAACICQPFHAVAFDSLYRLNILFTLSAGIGIALMWRDGARVYAVALFLIVGLFVDYMWAGLAVVVAAAWAARGGRFGLPLLALAIGALAVPNGNWFALGAIPILAAATYWTTSVPRWRWTFLAYYFGHLVLLAGYTTIVFPTFGRNLFVLVVLIIVLSASVFVADSLRDDRGL